MLNQGITFSRQLSNSGLFHLLVAVAVLPAYYIGGAEFKVVILPYVLILLLSMKADYFPALLIHFLPGSLVSPVMLAGCALAALLNFNELGRYGLKGLFVLALIPLPLLSYVLFAKVSDADATVVNIVQHNAMYFGLFVFFYSVLLSPQYHPLIGERILWVFIVASILQIFVMHDTTTVVRYVALSTPIFFAILFYSFFQRGTEKLNISLVLKIFPLMVIAAIGAKRLPLSFAILLCTILPILFLFSRLHLRGALQSIPIGKWMIFLAILSTVYLVGFAETRAYFGGNSTAQNISDIKDFTDILPALEFKALGDRKPLWEAAWRAIVEEKSLFPPIEPRKISFGASDVEVDFGAHNIALELLRYYGLIAGTIGTLVYLGLLGRMARIVVSYRVDSLLFIFGVTTFTNAFIGGVIGHYVLSDNFSFLILGLGGICYGCLRINESTA